MSRLPMKALYNLVRRRLRQEPAGWMEDSEIIAFTDFMLKYKGNECPHCDAEFPTYYGTTEKVVHKCACGYNYLITTKYVPSNAVFADSSSTTNTSTTYNYGTSDTWG